jgi:hypothetical protein
MRSVLELPIVLDVNRLHLPIDRRSVREALSAMLGSSPALAFDLDFARRRDGSIDYQSPTSRRSVTWDEWIRLPVRPFDHVIETARGWIRAPTVLMAPEYADMPMARPSLSPAPFFSGTTSSANIAAAGSIRARRALTM